MYRVVAMMAGAEGKRTAQFDRLLDALFCALTWSLGEGADVTLADASVLVCTITDGDLRVNDETVEVRSGPRSCSADPPRGLNLVDS